MNEFDFMETTGKNNKVIMSKDTPFINASYMVVQYDDVIKSPEFIFLYYLVTDFREDLYPAINQFIDLSPIDELGLEEIYEWYINRKEFEVFKNFKLQEGQTDEVYKYLRNELFVEVANIKPDIYLNDVTLNFVDILQRMRDKNLVKKVIVFSENPLTETEKQDFNRIFYNSDFILDHGSLEEIIQKYEITNDSTFVFSNSLLVNELLRLNKLNYSSILIADHYRYNYKEDNTTEIIDFTELLKNQIFHINYFENIY